VHPHPTPRVVRTATSTDLSSVVAIARTTRLFGFLSPSIFEQSINKHELLVAISDYLSIVAGFVRFHRRQDNIHTIYELYVVPHFRRLGYGTSLFLAVPTPKQLKCPNTPQYAPAHAFYLAQHPTSATPTTSNMTLYVFNDPTPTPIENS
jgi:GNAT superfamily N-acetyltransferase